MEGLTIIAERVGSQDFHGLVQGLNGCDTGTGNGGPRVELAGMSRDGLQKFLCVHRL